MRKSEFYFDLPAELIAQTPLKSREQSRLLCMDRRSGKLEHHHFYELPKLLQKGDCLVLNDSRVLPARLLGRVCNNRSDTKMMDRQPVLSSSKTDESEVVEVLLLHEIASSSTMWECLTRPGKKTRAGAKLVFGDGELTAAVVDVKDNGNRVIEFFYKGIFMEVLERLGKMPLPPYIHEYLEDVERYQTVYSKEVGSAAAPTAGLHFTEGLLDELINKGIFIYYLTLHVGLGTFRPVKTENIEDHAMHAEYFILNDETAKSINRVKKIGGRVIAVGTTSCRVLESCSCDDGLVSANTGFTDIFIYPGYSFKCIDGLITNFHLPESTLIMLVSAFAGKDSTLNAYNEAIKEKYRFFSFGDAMLIL